MLPRNVLCIDDDEMLQLYKTLFADVINPLIFIAPENMEQALSLVESRTIDLYILERWHPEIDGIELCRIIRQKDLQTPIIFFSGLAREGDRSQAFAAGANAYFVKAADFDKFIKTVKGLLNQNFSLPI